MKDLSSSQANKPSRNSFYTKKRPSPLHRDSAAGASKRKSPYAATTLASTAGAPPPATRKPQLAPIITDEQRYRDAQRLALAKDSRLLEEEYRADVKKYMHEMELCTMSSATSMDQQPEIRWHMRPCLVDFIVEIHLTFRLRPETLYLTLNIIDRYVSRRIVYVKHYQLVGCAALWIAAKFEDAKDRVPTVQDLHQICREAYDESAFIQMEGHVLATIQWMVGHPTAEAWLRLACVGCGIEDTKTQHVARFLMEITLFHREYVSYPPSAIASAALMLARFTTGKHHRPQDESDAALEIVHILDTQLAEQINQLSDTLVKKYSYSFYSKASTFILHFYLSGRRFVLASTCLPSLSTSHTLLPPITPTSASRPPPLSFGSATTTASDATEDMMPVTPGTPPSAYTSSDPFAVVNGSNHHHNLSHGHSSSLSSNGTSVTVSSTSSWRDKENIPKIAATVERPPQAHFAKAAATAGGAAGPGVASYGGFAGLTIGGNDAEDSSMYSSSPAFNGNGNANGRTALHDFNGFMNSPVLQPIVS